MRLSRLTMEDVASIVAVVITILTRTCTITNAFVMSSHIMMDGWMVYTELSQDSSVVYVKPLLTYQEGFSRRRVPVNISFISFTLPVCHWLRSLVNEVAPKNI